MKHQIIQNRREDGSFFYTIKEKPCIFNLWRGFNLPYIFKTKKAALNHLKNENENVVIEI